MAFSWKNFHWNNRLTGISKPCLTSAISWQDFRKITDDGMILNKLNPAANAVQVVGQYEGVFDGIGYANLSNSILFSKDDNFTITHHWETPSTTLSKHVAFGGSSYQGYFLNYTKNVIYIAYDTVSSYSVTYSLLPNTEYWIILTNKPELGQIEVHILNEHKNILLQKMVSNTRIPLAPLNRFSGRIADRRLVGTHYEFSVVYEGESILDLDFSTGKENKIYSKDPTANHATLVNMDLNTFWQQGEGKPTLALEGCNYSTATGYIPARNDGSELDALGNPIQIKPLDWANLPLYSFRYPSSLPIMDKANTVNWTDNTGGLDWSYAQLKSIPEIKKAPVQDMVFMKDVRLDKKMQEVLITDTPQAGACLDKTKKWTGLGK